MSDAVTVETNWKVLDKVNVGIFVPDNIDGEFVSMDPFHVWPGDFVNVCLGFDIVRRGTRGGKTLQVPLTINHILLLSAAGTATAVVSLALSPVQGSLMCLVQATIPQVVEDVLGLRF